MFLGQLFSHDIFIISFVMAMRILKTSSLMSPVSYISAIRNVSVSHRNSLHGSCVAFNAHLNVKNLMSLKFILQTIFYMDEV